MTDNDNTAKGMTAMRLDHTRCLHDNHPASRAHCRSLIRWVETQGFEIIPALDGDCDPTGQYHLLLTGCDEGWLNTFDSPHHAATAALEIIDEELHAEA